MLNATATRPPARPFSNLDDPPHRARTWARLDLRAIIADRLERRHRAVRERRVVQAFAEWHPEWHASLFDATFLASSTARTAIETRDPVALALAWTGQFRYTDANVRRRDMRRAARVASDFLVIVDDELAR